MEELWEKEHDEFHKTCMNKFRGMSDFNIWVFRNYQIASGNFYPKSIKDGQSFVLSDERSLSEITHFIENRKRKMICINDAEMSDSEFINAQTALIKSFGKILPEKSEYEL
jgi:hypothetical protein